MLVFVHIEKTAGTTLKFILRNSFGTKHCDTLKSKKEVFGQEDLERAKSIFGDIECLTGHNLIEPTRQLQEKDLTFLTVLREPLTRSASYYQDHCIRGKQQIRFEDWMADPQKQNMQTKRIAGEPDAEKAKRLLRDRYAFVGLTERFEESLKLLSIICPNRIDLKYKKKLVSPDNSIKEQLLNDPKRSELLKEANRADIELYEYVKNELFPARLADHQKEVKQIELPEPYESKDFVYGHKVSVWFNKLVYKTLLKVKK